MANRDCGPKSTVVMVKSVSLTDIRCGKRRKSRDNSEARTQRLKSGKCLAGVVGFPADFKFPTQPIEVAIINFATLQYVMQLCCTWMCHSQCIEPLSPCLTRSMCRRPTRVVLTNLRPFGMKDLPSCIAAFHYQFGAHPSSRSNSLRMR